MNTQMKSFLVVLVSCWTVVSAVLPNTYTDFNGVTWYYSANKCKSTTSLFSAYLSYVDTLRSTYTARTSKDCCLLVDTRNDCCVDELDVCRCNPNTVLCGQPTTTITPPTSTTSSTTTTTMTTTTPTTSTSTRSTTTTPTTVTTTPTRTTTTTLTTVTTTPTTVTTTPTRTTTTTPTTVTTTPTRTTTTTPTTVTTTPTRTTTTTSTTVTTTPTTVTTTPTTVTTTPTKTTTTTPTTVTTTPTTVTTTPTTVTTTTTRTTTPTTVTTTPTTVTTTPTKTTTTTPTTVTTTPTKTTTTTPTTVTTTPTTVTTTPTTVTTTPTKTTTTTPTTVTTTPTKTTTTTPTTVTTTPTRTTTVISTTSTPLTTTAPQISLCSAPTVRILNAAKVLDDCQYPGVANITAANGAVVVCNAILTSATVNGVYKRTFLTASSCKAIIMSQSSSGLVLDLQVGVQRYPLVTSFFNFIDGKDDIVYIDINPMYANLLNYLGACQKPACPYNDLTMSGKVDFSECRVVSWGVSNITNATSPRSDGLYETAVTFSPLGCSSIPKSSTKPSDICFRTTSGLNLMCYGDTGAPVYCKAPSNSEWILVGISQLAPSCNSTSEFRVLPYPG